MVHFLLLFFYVINSIVTANNYANRCLDLDDFKNKINCSFNPDDYLDVPQIIRRHGYPVESHLVISDGYMLGIHRIPGAKNGTKGKHPVLLQHGLFGSSADWILNGNNSLGFTLADQGYDVWLGNDRGNVYSNGHISLPSWSEQYWNFSWHEMAVFDLPAVIFYIANTTGRPGDLMYIGHSMGTTQFFVLSSTLPNVAKNIKFMVALAPTAYMTHMTAPIRYLAPYSNDLQWIMDQLGIKDALPNSKFFKFLSHQCEQNRIEKICRNLILLVGGSEINELNLEILPAILNHDPAGSSIKNLVHYGQEIQAGGQFQYYDYGAKGNLIKYGTLTPPLYPLKNIKIPVYLMYALNDKLTNFTDVLRLSQKLSSLIGLYKVPMKAFDHLDFIFGKDAFEVVYKQVLKMLKHFTY